MPIDALLMDSPIQTDRCRTATCHKCSTNNSSGDEIANVNFFTTRSYTYYKIQ